MRLLSIFACVLFYLMLCVGAAAGVIALGVHVSVIVAVFAGVVALAFLAALAAWWISS